VIEKILRHCDLREKSPAWFCLEATAQFTHSSAVVEKELL
jgi:hypothetical protein